MDGAWVHRPGSVHLYTVSVSWDPKKAASNVQKHGIRFADAVPVLEDEFLVSMRDDAHGEERWVAIGIDSFARILVVVYAWRGDDIRLISARQATQGERELYLEGQ